MWLVLALISAFLFALGQIFLKKGYREFSPKATYFLNGVSCVILLVAYAILRGGLSFNYRFWPDFWYLFQPAGYLLFIQALNKGKVSLVSTLTATAPVLTIMIAFLLLDEKLTTRQIFIVFWVILGVVLAGFSKESLKDLRTSKSESWLFWGLIAAFGFAVNNVMSKVLITNADSATFFFNVGLMNLIYALIWSFKKKSNWERYRRMSKRDFLPTTLGVIFPNLAAIAFFEALNLGYISLVAAVSNISLPLTVVFAWLFLNERLTKWQMVGMAMVAMGMFLISQ